MADIWNKFLRCECPFQCLKEVLKALMVLVGSDNEMLSKQCYWYLQLKTHAVLECHLPVLACSSIGEAVESWPSTKHWCWDFGKCWVQSKWSSSSDCSQWITHGSVIYHTFTGDDLHFSHLHRWRPSLFTPIPHLHRWRPSLFTPIPHLHWWRPSLFTPIPHLHRWRPSLFTPIPHLHRGRTGAHLHRWRPSLFTPIPHLHRWRTSHFTACFLYVVVFFDYWVQSDENDWLCMCSKLSVHTHTHTHTVQSYSVWVKLVRR